MTIATTDIRFSSNGDGSTTAFTYARAFRSLDDIVVVLVSSAGVETAQTRNTHYTLSGASDGFGGYSSGMITMSTAPASGSKLVRYRDPSLVQETDATDLSTSPQALENAFDLIEHKLQRFDDRADRSVRMREGDTTAFDPRLPFTGSLTAGHAFIVGGDSLSITTGAVATGGTISSAWLPIVTAGTIAAGLSAAGLGTEDTPTFSGLTLTQTTAQSALFTGTYGGSGSPLAVNASAGYTANTTVIYGTPGTGTADALTTALQGTSHLAAGTRGIACGVLAEAYCDGTWGPGASAEAGACAIFTTGSTSRGGTVFGAGFHANAITTTGAVMRGIEVDTIATAAPASKIGVEIVSTNADTGAVSGTVTASGSGNTYTDSVAVRVSAVGSGIGYSAAIMTNKPSGGTQPIPTTGRMWVADGNYTVTDGLHWGGLTFTGNMITGSSGNAKARITPKFDFGSTGHDYLLQSTNYNAAAATIDNTALGTVLTAHVGTNAGRGAFEIRTGAVNTAPTVVATFNAGLLMVGATGGDKGVGTINATAVYDDNSLLTCYVLDAAIDGAIDDAKWDARVPDRYAEVDGERVPVETRTHEDMRKFKARLGTDTDPLDLDAYEKHWREKRHLTSMPNEEKFDPEVGLPTGSWIQRLVETVEIQAVHIAKLNARLKVLEAGL